MECFAFAIFSPVNRLSDPFIYSGKAFAYNFDDLYGGLTRSHNYSLPLKDYPGKFEFTWLFYW